MSAIVELAAAWSGCVGEQLDGWAWNGDVGGTRAYEEPIDLPGAWQRRRDLA